MKLLALFFLILFQFRGILGITIANHLSNSSPRLGETITLRCAITDGTASIVLWWKDKQRSPGAKVVSYDCSVVSKEYKSRLKTVQCDMNNYNFQLSNVQISDGGEWVCEADGQEATTSLKLNIQVPLNVQIKISRTTVRENEFVKLECATNRERIERYQWLWRKGNTTAAQVIQDSRTRTENGKYLKFARIPYDRSGTYTCKAWNRRGMGRASTVLNVQYSPRIDPEATKFDVVGEIGKEATFELFIIANPTPMSTGYIWSKEGNVILKSSTEYEIMSGPTFSKLTIKAVKVADYKSYTCSVKTSAFQAEVFKFILLKAEKPLIDINRVHKKVTVRWKQVTGEYTALKIRYCQIGTAHCWNYTVPNPEDNTAAFFVDPDKSYYYYLMVEDGDIVYRSAEYEEVEGGSNLQAVDLKTNTVFAVACSLAGAGALAITVVIVTIVLWKRGLVRLGQWQNHRPANDPVECVDTRVTLTTSGKGYVQTNTNSHEHELSMITGHHLPEHGVIEVEPEYQDDDPDAYDYVDSLTALQRGTSAQNPALQPPENQMGCAVATEEHGQDSLSEAIEEQEREKPEGKGSIIRIVIQEQPEEHHESGSSQTNGANGQTTNDDMADDQESSYAHLGPIAPVIHGEYINLRQSSQE